MWDQTNSASTACINKKLSKYFLEVQAGLREGSAVTTPDVAQTIDSPNVWQELRRELEDVGINAAVLEDRRGYVLGQIKQAIQDGMFDERCDSAGAQAPPMAPESSHNSEAMFVNSQDRGSETSSNIGSQITLTPGANLRMAITLFEDDLRRRNAEWQIGEGGSAGEGVGEGSSGPNMASEAAPMTPPVLVRRRTDPVALLRKLFKKNTDIIEAASDGDYDKVAKLVSLGMDVNARDPWGWSALSMCGYGGYGQIARLLFAHGADLDNVDVDGDTPSKLAAQRGHAHLIIMIDDERAARDLRTREQDTEVPRR